MHRLVHIVVRGLVHIAVHSVVRRLVHCVSVLRLTIVYWLNRDLSEQTGLLFVADDREQFEDDKGTVDPSK